MKTSPSIVRSVVRAHVIALLLAAVAIVVVGTAVAALVIVARDDATAVAQARTLGSELDNHAADTPPQLDVLIRHELEEQRWFHRRTEVYRDGARLGGGGPLLFEGWLGNPDGCSLAVLQGVRSRVCVIHEARNTAFVIASPLAPILASLAPIVGAVSLVTFASAFVFALIGARVVTRRLAPLSAFERTLTTLPPLGADRNVPTEWGAAEVDTLAATFNDLLRRIDDAVERERRFVADAAHELRTPLTRLRGQLDLAIAELKDGVSAEARLGAAARNCMDLARTTEALLALARDEIVAEEVVNLADLARAQQEALEGDAVARLSVKGDDEVLVRGDEALLSLAVRNLVENAMKYTNDAVTITVTSSANAAIVVVADCGPGIPASEIGRVCEPFVRGRERIKSVRGTGLGLALARHVAVLHEGSLELRNRSERGLDAELRLVPWRPQSLASG